METYPLHLLATISLLLPTIIIERRSAIRQFLNILITYGLSHFFFQHLCVQNNRFQSRARPLPLPNLPRSVCGGRKETTKAGDGPRTEEKSFRGPRTVGGEEDQLSRAATTEANARGNYCTIRQERRRRATSKRHLDTCSNLTPTNQKEKERKREISIREIEGRQAPLNWKKEETEERDRNIHRRRSRFPSRGRRPAPEKPGLLICQKIYIFPAGSQLGIK